MWQNQVPQACRSAFRFDLNRASQPMVAWITISRSRFFVPGNGRDHYRPQLESAMREIQFNDGEVFMSKSQDAKKSTKKPPSKTPKEKKEAKKLKKAERKH